VNSENKSTIHINGVKYNALSGNRIKPITLGSIDGFVKHKKLNQTTTATNETPTNSTSYFTAPRKLNNVEKTPAKSNTLMREAVSKPDKKYRPITKISTPIQPSNNLPAIQKPVMATSIDPKLQHRAMTYRQNRLVSRYSATVYPAKNYQNVISNSQPQTSLPNSSQTEAKKDIFQQAIDNANSHNQPKLTRKQLKAAHGHKLSKKFKLLSTSAVGLLIVAILSYGVYQNIPNIMAKVAASKAGFSATVPSYKPSGFSLANVGYQPGTVQFNYKSNLSTSKYSIIEHSSTWDSATLVSNLLLPTSGSKYKEITLKGIQIFLYGKDNASWVNHGILYLVKGNNALSTNQLLQLASNI